MKTFLFTFSRTLSKGKWSVEEEKSIFIYTDKYPCKSPPEAVNMELGDFLPMYCACMCS